ncbi:MAG TPA: hypothetical protein VGR28_08525 [Candidatus Thermoplasmatota archaeon]|nr:hypothetical protein [Candidatus Thermoplasmatota archaeon]
MKVVQTATSTIAVDLYTTGPATAGAAGAGACQTDGAGEPIFCFVFTALLSPNRLILTPTAGPAPVNADVNARTSAGDAACNFVCLGLTLADVAPGTYYFVLWGGGGSGTDLEVRTAAGSAVANAGSGLLAADPEFNNGHPDIQVQQGMAPATVGAKLVQDASIGFSAPARLYGIFFDFDFLKFVCVAVCVFPMDFVSPLGVSTSQVSWSGPGGAGGNGKFNFYLGTAAGDYTFRVDQKVDAYGPCTGAIVVIACVLEDFAFINAGSVSVPA